MVIDNQASLAWDSLAPGWLQGGQRIASPNCDARPADARPELIVIHNISLPPNEFGGDGVVQLFTNQLDPQAHPFYAEIAHLRVSAHFFIRRTGVLYQFVSVDERAWHAGVSAFCGRERCNDFSVGIELEGTDTQPYTEAQYAQLTELLTALCQCYPIQAITGHEHIAPGRKTDPGPAFDWSRIHQWQAQWQTQLQAQSETLGGKAALFTAGVKSHVQIFSHICI